MRVALLLLAAVVAAFAAQLSDGFRDPCNDLEYRLNRFAEAYNAFCLTLKEGNFDLRGAKRLSKLWREVEAECWPRQGKEKH